MSARAAETPSASKPTRVLIVEDDDDLRPMLALLLELEGMSVTTAANGILALTLLESAPADVDVVVLDWLMPIMGGAELVSEIARRPSLATLPVIVLSGARDVSRAEHPGVRAVLGKPADLATLTRAIRDAARKPSSNGGSAP